MTMYVYVNKKEYAPYKKEVEDIIRHAQRIMKQKYKTTFQYKLIGSAGRHLVTRIKNGNKGYDFDYNLILQESDLWENPKKLKQQFMNAFDEAVKGTPYIKLEDETPYNKLEDSTSSITIKAIDKKNSKIIRSFDLAIIYYLDDEEPDEGYKYLRNLKNGQYEFWLRKLSVNIDTKLDEIEEYEDGWNMVREEYLKLKNRNKDSNKKSFTLYLESVNNVHNQLMQYEEKERQQQTFPNCGYAYLGSPNSYRKTK